MKEKLKNWSGWTGESVKVSDSESGNETGSLKRVKNDESFNEEMIKINFKGQRGKVNPRLEQFL